jgi:hypothetical protein
MPAKPVQPKAKSDNVFGQLRKAAKMFRAGGRTPALPPTIGRHFRMQSRAMGEHAVRRSCPLL